MKYLVLIGVGLLLPFVLQAQTCTEPTTVVVIRHAEKVQDGTKDPDLTQTGYDRAADLVERMRFSPIQGLYATQFKRNRATLEALSTQRNLPIQIQTMNESNRATFAQELRDLIQSHQCGGVAVVAHHSNTVPLIANAWAGTSLPEFDDSDYGNFFVFVLPRTGQAILIRAKF